MDAATFCLCLLGVDQAPEAQGLQAQPCCKDENGRPDLAGASQCHTSSARGATKPQRGSPRRTYQKGPPCYQGGPLSCHSTPVGLPRGGVETVGVSALIPSRHSPHLH